MVAGWVTQAMENIKNPGHCSQPEALLQLESCPFPGQPDSPVIVDIQRRSSVPPLGITSKRYTDCRASIQLLPLPILLPPFLTTLVPESIAPYLSCIQTLFTIFLCNSSCSIWIFGDRDENTYFHKVLLVIIMYPVWSSHSPKQCGLRWRRPARKSRW